MISSPQLSTQPRPDNNGQSNRLHYYRRIFSAYLGRGTSQLTFWHEVPEVNHRFTVDRLGEYYMVFGSKADYTGPFDELGVPLLDYRGALGRQYNPIAIAQYGLGNYNLFVRSGDPHRRRKFLDIANWLVSNLTSNSNGVRVWMHNFDWDYRDRLCAPWYSGLAQGQALSVLLRAHQISGDPGYLEAARNAFLSFTVDVSQGGVACRDKQGHLWFEEYIVSPPTHILNGFLWALWGVYDYFLASGDARARELFESAVQTLHGRLNDFDTGFWSLYEQSGTRLRMIASPFYHSLHIVQLRVMEKLTGDKFFGEFAERWDSYRASRMNRTRALAQKALFKLCYY
jgi:heparosan-N-sulfate-glucuronate 5-epimerase